MLVETGRNKGLSLSRKKRDALFPDAARNCPALSICGMIVMFQGE